MATISRTVSVATMVLETRPLQQVDQEVTDQSIDDDRNQGMPRRKRVARLVQQRREQGGPHAFHFQLRDLNDQSGPHNPQRQRPGGAANLADKEPRNGGHRSDADDPRRRSQKRHDLGGFREARPLMRVQPEQNRLIDPDDLPTAAVNGLQNFHKNMERSDRQHKADRNVPGDEFRGFAGGGMIGRFVLRGFSFHNQGCTHLPWEIILDFPQEPLLPFPLLIR